MTMRAPARAGAIAAFSLSVGLTAWAFGTDPAAAGHRITNGAPMTKQATGTFDVKVVPQPHDAAVGDATIGRMALDKQFHGDLQGTSKGQMLAAGTDVKGSAGYVALERVNATLNGRTGTFALQHSGTMTRGEPALSITVVPDSATGQLAGLSGRMNIEIAGGEHSYTLEYAFADAAR